MDSISIPIIQLVLFLLILLPSVIIHEVSHGWVALRLGDPTAKLAGRLTLNPIRHLDLVGSFIVPLLLIFSAGFALGWAKPVPYNPSLLSRDYKYGPLKVALAGPASNLLLAIVAAIIARIFTPFLGLGPMVVLEVVVFINVLLLVFNLIPIPPLDGSKVISTFLSPRQAVAFEQVGFFGVLIILALLLLFPPFFGFVSQITSTITNLLLK
ncbi:MAG: site-2 protease family protein [Candidatus Colwellbacteria bacterium]|nr:site-2 protease family protein [Candidatus Colwellbacteria bacterium]